MPSLPARVPLLMRKFDLDTLDSSRGPHVFTWLGCEGSAREIQCTISLDNIKTEKFGNCARCSSHQDQRPGVRWPFLSNSAVKCCSECGFFTNLIDMHQWWKREKERREKSYPLIKSYAHIPRLCGAAVSELEKIPMGPCYPNEENCMRHLPSPMIQIFSLRFAKTPVNSGSKQTA
uniref:Uncharacterized protein n=1 Tax=Setaria viridis TaxID=4556 RepID=A0A4U6V0W6_SETVI|nr:hypothetical protein SEVIR_4G154800v2 [Setaria viridis]